jgi:ATP-dependent Lon protease
MKEPPSDRGSDHLDAKIPSELPVLPLRDMVVYPFIIAPLSVAREISIQAVDRGLSMNRMILLAAQKDREQEDPEEDGLFRVGTVAVIMRMLKLPDDRIRVLVQGVCRARMERIVSTRPYLEARISQVQDLAHDPDSVEKISLRPTWR